MISNDNQLASFINNPQNKLKKSLDFHDNKTALMEN